MVHDIVQTSKMAMEYDGSLIDVTKVAETDLDNGHLVAIDATTGEVRYATLADTKVYLHTSVEKMYFIAYGFEDFYVQEGNPVRITAFRKGDIFATTAIDPLCSATIKVGDLVKVGANGAVLVDNTLTQATAGNFMAVVTKVGTLGFHKPEAVFLQVLAD